MTKRTLLCLTDLHYCDNQANFTDDNKGLGDAFGGAFRTSSFTKLNAVLQHGFRPEELDVVAVVGDITTRGQQSGLSAFSTELVPTLEPLVPEHAICIVPGNHDVTWRLDPNSPGYFDRKFEHFIGMVNDAKATTCLLPRGEIKRDPQSKVAFYRPKNGPIYLDEDKQILVLNINSALRCGELDKDMYLDFQSWNKDAISLSAITNGTGSAGERLIAPHFIRDVVQFTQEQLEQLQVAVLKEKNRLKDQWEDYLKVALVHHHLVHFPGQAMEHKGYEFMLDSSLLLEFLTGFDFDLAMTGHKHHAYEMVHHFKDKTIFIVGGSTVGGYASPGSFRGIRLVEFESDRNCKRLTIKNIVEDLSQADVRSAIEKIKPIKLEIAKDHRAGRIKHAQTRGLSYRELIATTDIAASGDAVRSVQIDGLLITNPSLRSYSDVVDLPTTSGYIDVRHFRASSRDVAIDVEHTSAPSATPKTAQYKLSFRPALGIDEAIGYQYQWPTINSYALDTSEFKRMYESKHTAMSDTEYASFQAKEAVEKLTLIVRLPEQFEFIEPPRIRVAMPNTAQEGRWWRLDEDAMQTLRANHAMQYIPALKTVQLTVDTPDPGLSYGIEWKLPEVHPKRGSEQISETIRRIKRKAPLSPKILYTVLSGVRGTLLGGWSGQFDMNLMIFGLNGRPGILESIVAGRFTQLVDGIEPKTMDSLAIKAVFAYGYGVAGRAFRANRPQLHVSPDIYPGSEEGEKLNFYLRVDNDLDHKRLICFPVHKPVSQDEFNNQPNVYTTCEPYGILNIGSEDEDCPLSPDSLSGAEMEPKLKFMQHKLNIDLWQELFGPEEAEEKRTRTVQMVSRRKHT